MLRILLLICFMVLLIACQEQENKIKVIYFDKGSKTDISKDINIREFLAEVRTLFAETDDMLKLHVDSSRISEIIRREEGIEITFVKEQEFLSNEFGSMKVNKLLIPLSGEFVGNEASPVITLFPAKDSYYSGPLRNSNGYMRLMLIKEKILSNKNK